jgi:arsenite methyltransferase
MPKLNTPTSVSSCCSTDTQATCCQPTEKDACCGSVTGDSSCGCSTNEPRADVRETVCAK